MPRLVLRTHVGPFLFGSLTVLFLFLFQFLLNYLDELVGKGLSEWVILKLIVFNIAWMVVLAVPMGVLFSTLMTFGGMSANREITVIKAGGGSLFRMMLPVLFAGIFVTGGLFWFFDKVQPETNHRAKILMSDIKRKKPTFNLKPGQFSSDLEGYNILARRIDSLSGKLEGVTIYDRTDRKRTNVVSADSGFVEPTADFNTFVVNLYDGEIHALIPYETENYRKINFKRYRILIETRGYAFERTDVYADGYRGDREMNIAMMREKVEEFDSQYLEKDKKIDSLVDLNFRRMSEAGIKDANPKIVDVAANDSLEALRRALDRVSFFRTQLKSEYDYGERSELRARKYEVEIHKKYVIPFACILFIMVGCPLGVLTKGGNFGISAAICLGFYIVYWIFLLGGEKLADRGLMEPFISMWIGNFVILAVGVILTLKVNSESLRIPGLRLFKKLIRKTKAKK